MTRLALAFVLLFVAVAAHAQTIYVSGSAYGGIPAGSDTTGNGSKSAPYATLGRALTAAPTGATILLNGNPAKSTVYRETLTITRGVTIGAVKALGATIAPATSGPVLTISPAQAVFIGAVTIDAEGSAVSNLYLASPSAVPFALALAGTALLNGAQHAIDTAPHLHAVLMLDGIAVECDCAGAALDLRSLDSGSGISISGGDYQHHIPAGPFFGQSGWLIEAVAPGVTFSADGFAALVDTAGKTGVSPDYENGIEVLNIRAASVTNAHITVTDPYHKLEASPLHFSASLDGGALDSSEAHAAGNTIATDTDGSDCIAVGQEEATPAAFMANGALIERNICSTSATDQARDSHGLFVGFNGATIVRENLIVGTGSALVDKGARDSLYEGNVLLDASAVYMLGKGTAGARFLHNTIVMAPGFKGTGVYVESDPDADNANSTGVLIAANIFYDAGTAGAEMVVVRDAQDATLRYNDYRVGSGALARLPFGWHGKRYASIAAWQIAQEPTALADDPGFVDAAGGDYHLLPASALAKRIPRSFGPLRDFDGRRFLSPGNPGAFQIESRSDTR